MLMLYMILLSHIFHNGEHFGEYYLQVLPSISSNIIPINFTKKIKIGPISIENYKKLKLYKDKAMKGHNSKPKRNKINKITRYRIDHRLNH